MSDLLYKLSEEEFKELASEFIQHTFAPDSLIVNEIIVSGSRKVQADITFISKEKSNTFVEVKHKKQLPRHIQARIINFAQKNRELGFENFILCTSAPISQPDKAHIISMCRNAGYQKTEIIDKEQFEYFINEKNKNKVVQNLALKYKSQTIKLFFSAIIPLFLSIYTLLIPFVTEKKKETNLNEGIFNVEKALSNIKNLEDDLKNIQSELKETQRKSKAITDEYERVQAIKKLSKKEINSLKLIFGQKPTPWWQKWLDHFIGFVIGIFASMFATIILEKRRKKKALEDDTSYSDSI